VTVIPRLSVAARSRSDHVCTLQILGGGEGTTQGVFTQSNIAVTLFAVSKGIPEILKTGGATQAALAAHLGIADSTLSLKLSGDRHWKVDEANRALAFLRQFDDTLTLDDLFGAEGEQLRLPISYGGRRRKSSQAGGAAA
jgi:hypothetical protein